MDGGPVYTCRIGKATCYMTDDVFIFYATEDNDFAADVACGLKANGISVWFAPLSLKVGEKL
jgi:hypothetical protein